MHQQQNRNYPIVKIVLVGDAGVGKSAIFLSYAENTFPTDYMTTIGVDFMFKRIVVDGQTVKLQLWDTAGQERFRAITSGYYRGADAIVLVYDITCRGSFLSLHNWVDAIRQKEPDARFVIVGNKRDLYAKRTVTQEEAGSFSVALEAPYFEVSAKTAHRLADVFERIATDTLRSQMEEAAKTEVKTETVATISILPTSTKSIFSRLC